MSVLELDSSVAVWAAVAEDAFRETVPPELKGKERLLHPVTAITRHIERLRAVRHADAISSEVIAECLRNDEVQKNDKVQQLYKGFADNMRERLPVAADRITDMSALSGAEVRDHIAETTEAAHDGDLVSTYLLEAWSVVKRVHDDNPVISEGKAYDHRHQAAVGRIHQLFGTTGIERTQPPSFLSGSTVTGFTSPLGIEIMEIVDPSTGDNLDFRHGRNFEPAMLTLMATPLQTTA